MTRSSGGRQSVVDQISEGATREPPRTQRGARTRAKLITAARTVFERDGYLDARLTDIAAEAGTATGSFYTYFDGKEEAFAAVLAELQDEMLHPHVREMTDSDDPIVVIEASNRAYLTSYRRNAKLMHLLDQVASIDENFRELRRQRGAAFVARNAQRIRELQEQSVADADINPELAASALSGMVSRMAHDTYVLGEDWELEDLVTTLTQLWVNALAIPATQ